MKFLDQLSVRGRSLLRRTTPTGRPASLAFRVDGFDAPTEVPSLLTPDDWTHHLVDLVRHYGALPVRVIGEPDHPMLSELARVAWRLECPVTIRTGPAGLNRRVADRLVDSGARRVELRAGEGLEDAIRALAAARLDRGSRLEIVVESGAALVAEGEHARAAGADGVLLAIPWSGRVQTGEAKAWQASFHRTPAEVLAVGARYDGVGPGAPREGGSCPVGRKRWELRPDGTLAACAFKPGAARFQGEPVDLSEHLGHIRSCDRVCVHADLR